MIARPKLFRSAKVFGLPCLLMNAGIAKSVASVIISLASVTIAAALPDLTPSQQPNWNDKIPVGVTQLSGSGAHNYNGPYVNNQTLYFNWASTNQGTTNASGYRVHVEVTGTGGGAWDSTNVSTAAGFVTFLTNDQPFGPLAGGTHTLKVWVDYDNVVSESNESNNYYERTITVTTSGQADLTPSQQPNWNDKIPVGVTQLSGSAAHNYNGPYPDNQTLYFNWASTNQGTANASGYRVHVEVTGTGGGAWDSTNVSTAAGFVTFLTNDQPFGPLAGGTHTLKVWVDYDNAVGESNESNNYYERTITVTGFTPTPTPPVTPTPPPGAPTISSINPSSVPGSTNYRLFTINGSNFVTGSVVQVGFQDNNYAWQNTSSTPTIISSSQLTVQIRTDLTVDTWNVRIQNPGGQYSNTGHFSVTAQPQPDLVPSQVTVSPGSFVLGSPVTVSFTVANIGNASAPASVTRLRINTSPTTTNAADMSLGDVATPSLAAGQSIVLSKAVTPTGIAAGTYYVWVSVDNTNVTNQSNATNDFAHSPPVSVSSAPGIQPPVIQTPLSGNQTINHDDVAVLNVLATGTAPLTYQWKRDNNLIPGTTTFSSIRTNQPGTYTVGVSNPGGGPVAGGSATVTVNPFSNQPPPDIGALTAFGAFNSFWDTVVITHGWQPCLPACSYNPNGTDWQGSMAQTIKNRFNHQVNVLLFAWPEAYTTYLNPTWPRAMTAHEGSQLASSLQAFLGPNYQAKLQFVGHSYGSFVNAFAINHMSQQHVHQVSILDAPIKIRLSSGFQILFNQDKNIFRDNLPKEQVDYVDSYIAENSLYGLLFGGSIDGAAPNGGLPLGTDHPGTTCYYINTVTNAATCSPGPFPTPTPPQLGFNCSALLSPVPVPIPRWSPPQVGSQSVGLPLDVPSTIFGDVTQLPDTVAGSTQNVLRLQTAGGGGSPRGGSQNQAMVSSGDSAVEFEVAIPADAEDMRVSFRFPQLGDGEWMAISVNDEVLYGFLGQSFIGTHYDEAIIPISKFAGQTGVVRVILHVASGSPAEVRIANLHFESRADASAPSTLANISTRLRVETGDNALIGGMIATGTASKRVIIRAIGPSLTSLGIAGALENPTLELFQGSTLLMSNDDWQNSGQQAEIAASGFAPSNTAESAIIWVLVPGQGYTAIVRGKNQTTGVGVVEAYDLDRGAASKLANISTRGFVSTGENVMIGGMIVVGSTPANILVRAIGPSLTNVGVPNALPDPTLSLHDGNGTLIAFNNDWKTRPNGSSQQAEIEATGIPPSDNLESAIVGGVPPGAYTAIVRGLNDTTGVALVEAYQLQ